MKKMRIHTPYLIVSMTLILLLSVCSEKQQKQTESLCDFVDPFIGTDYHGHTFPGASLPFSMVQLSPDTRTMGWDACAGYHYSDSSILGFSHTHLSGTGIGDYGDILFMPFTESVSLDAGPEENIDAGYRSRFDRETEKARPGYYRVKLTDDDIDVELTSTTRAGMHRYTFPEANQAGILIDLTHTLHGHKNPLHEIRIVNDQEIQGLKLTSGWARHHTVYFTAKFSKPFEAEIYMDNVLQEGKTNISGQNAKMKLIFKTKEGEQVLAKVGISAVSYEGSALNLETEIPGWDFDQISSEAEDTWERELSRIRVKTDDVSEKRTFYTALYHTYMYPGVFSDVDGSYKGMDHENHQSDIKNYTVFSLWDTYRALHPLFTILKPEYNQELIRSLLRKYDEGGILPKWGLASNYTGTMIGSHAVSVIVDAYMKGHRNFDTEKALEAIIYSVNWDTLKEVSSSAAMVWRRLMPDAKLYEEKYGFIPCDLANRSVSIGLEYAYNYWAVAIMAEDMGRHEIAQAYYEKSKRYKTYFDKETGFMRGKNLDGSWIEPFHPRFANHKGSDPYVEGNAWQWTWFVPHDVAGLAELMGGRETFSQKLDSLFTVSSEVLGEDAGGDITGLIGQYAHGNEPSHHIAYMFNEVEQPWRTQEIVSEILNEFYTDQPDGLCGNEDCGQMSAWYILNSLGFYPMCPGDVRYSIGRPSFDEVKIDLENGEIFTILAENRSADNRYVQEVRLNGEKLSEPYITHQEIESGGTLVYVMGPDKKIFFK